jgi:hypothetical protein
MKRPSFQFYPSDWLRDTALRSCSTGARGLWMDMICFMHEGKPYGHLKVGDKVILPSNLARMVGDNSDVVADWLLELSQAGVYDTTEDGVIFSKRMVRDENLRQIRAAGGSKGGNPALMDKGKVNLEDKQKSTPSSSSASSSTNKEKTQRGSRLPTDWTLPNDWKAWAEQERPDLNTKTVADSFKDFWIAKAGAGGVKLDWQATWRNWIRSQSAPKTFANKFDVAHITTPTPPNQDAALRKIAEDRKKAVPPSLETLEKIAELRKRTA